MTKEELIAMGMTAEQADKVLAKQTEEMKSFVPRARLDEETGKVTALNTQLADRDKDIKTLQAAAGKGTDLEKQLTELQTKYDADKTSFEKQIADVKLDAALDAALVANKARDPISVKAHLDKTKIKLNGDKLEGLDLSQLQKDKPYLFADEQTRDQGNNFQSGGGSGEAGSTAALREAFGLPPTPQTK